MLKKTFISKDKPNQLLNDLSKIKQILQRDHQKISRQINRKNSQQDVSIHYDELLFTLLKKKVKLIAINLFLIGKYNQKNQTKPYQIVKNNWQIHLTDQKIVEDAITLLQADVGRPWKALYLQKDKIQHKKAKFQQYELQNLKNRKQIKNRMKVLKDEMVEVQANMNMSKKQEDVVKYTKKYRQLQKEYKHWKQRSRNLKQLSINDRIQQSQEANIMIKQKVNRMLTLVTQIQTQQQQVKRLKTLSYSTQSRPLQKQKQVRSFQNIFNYYARLNIHKPLFFQDMQKNLQIVQLQGFMKFLKDFQLSRLLSNSQILQIFKKKTKSMRYINLQQFTQIFQDIYIEQCNKRNISFQPAQFDKYIQNQVLSKDKIRKIFRIRIKTQDLKGNLQNSIAHSKLSKYVFQPSSHSGKFKQSINQTLLQNKKSYQFAPCMKSNSIAKYKIKQNKSQRNIQQRSMISNNKNPESSSRISQYSKVTKLSRLFTKKSSYAHKFRQKMSQYQKGKRTSNPDNQNIQKSLEQLQKIVSQQNEAGQNVYIIEQKRNQKELERQKQLQELQMLIGIQKDDQFLERHLLPSVNKIEFNHKRRFMF